MLVYHAAFDTYHTVFRMLRILGELRTAEIDRLRILDFYLLFPGQLHNARLTRSATGKKRLIPKETTYNRVENPRRLFLQIQPYQEQALWELAARGLIVRDHLRDRIVTRTQDKLPRTLDRAVSEANTRDRELLALLVGSLQDIDLHGKRGLKDRTGLFEYRYDNS